MKDVLLVLLVAVLCSSYIKIAFFNLNTSPKKCVLSSSTEAPLCVRVCPSSMMHYLKLGLTSVACSTSKMRWIIK